MGVTGLIDLLKKKAPEAIKTIPVTKLVNKYVCVDASLYIHKWTSIGFRMKIKYQNAYNNHIQGIFFKTAKMIMRGIYPVYVFDGPPPALKSGVIAERKKLREQGLTHTIPHGAFDECIELLTLMGVQVIKAPSEAEAQAAALTINGAVVDTVDSDVLAFGARCMISHMDTNARVVTSIEIADVLSDLKLTMPSFIDLCILIGCDYTARSFGPMRALALISKHGSIEEIIRAGVFVKVDFVAARAEFTSPDVIDVALIEPKKLNRGEFNRLSVYIRDKISPARVEKTLVDLAKFYTIA